MKRFFLCWFFYRFFVDFVILKRCCLFYFVDVFLCGKWECGNWKLACFVSFWNELSFWIWEVENGNFYIFKFVCSSVFLFEMFVLKGEYWGWYVQLNWVNIYWRFCGTVYICSIESFLLKYVDCCEILVFWSFRALLINVWLVSL